MVLGIPINLAQFEKIIKASKGGVNFWFFWSN